MQKNSFISLDRNACEKKAVLFEIETVIQTMITLAAKLAEYEKMEIKAACSQSVSPSILSDYIARFVT
ncbi:hypothetical protein [Thermaerobacillus caldiproteolyticus]|uniref:hypothetical protein n=1 Tax=Thermaerobacillus caldiproteolyticus TaxID=247480 RepID=UPI00188A251B|nr:hypothetical protein [Anoxybacillus caldiproteolyticus]QPA30485.1 hypothetical protein ISX45_12885 [Anoxybacillus caldiproteolyticus]